MPPVGFEPVIPESVRPWTHSLDHADTGIGRFACTQTNKVEHERGSFHKIRIQVGRKIGRQLTLCCIVTPSCIVLLFCRNHFIDVYRHMLIAALEFMLRR